MMAHMTENHSSKGVRPIILGVDMSRVARWAKLQLIRIRQNLPTVALFHTAACPLLCSCLPFCVENDTFHRRLSAVHPDEY